MNEVRRLKAEIERLRAILEQMQANAVKCSEARLHYEAEVERLRSEIACGRTAG